MLLLKNTIFLFLLIIITGSLFGQTSCFSKMKVSTQKGGVKVLFPPKNDSQISIHFFHCGVNQIYAIGQVDYFDSLSVRMTEEPSYSIQSGTDWIGPYFVCRSENADKKLPQRFTGGWHGSNGDGTGKPTAQPQSIKIIVDGKNVGNDFNILCDSLSLDVVNYIQGFDDSTFNRPILKETVNYTLTVNGEVHVHVNISALVDITIQRYYGMQSVNFPVFDSVSYATPQKEINTAFVKADSRCSSNANVNSIILKDTAGKHQLKLVMENKGLGTFKYLAEELPRAFSASYRKSYFNLIHGKYLPLKKGESVFWEGSYFFY